MNRRLAILCFSLIVFSNGYAQTPAPAGAVAGIPVYDVASIKLNKTESGSTSISTHDGTMDATNVSLASLIEMGYGYRREQVIGLEGPVASARFDIRAKVVDPDIKRIESLTREERRSMLRPLLTGRFHLQFHIESRVQPAYELVVAKSGLKMTQTSSGDAKLDESVKFRNLTPGSVNVNISSRHAELTAHDSDLTGLVNVLSNELRRPVIDKTALTGRYDLWLKWTPESAAAGLDKSDSGSAAPDDPTIFTAVQEQLGLHLESARLPVNVLVIDKMEMPTED